MGTTLPSLSLPMIKEPCVKTALTIQTKCPSCQTYKEGTVYVNLETLSNLYYVATNVPAWLGKVLSEETFTCDTCGSKWSHVTVHDVTEKQERIDMIPKLVSGPTK